MSENTSKPIRVRRSRAKGSRLKDSVSNGLPIVCVTRPLKWSNPFKKMPGETSQQRIVEAFKNSLDEAKIAEIKRDLRGKNLACWCQINEPWCHADVLLRIANE